MKSVTGLSHVESLDDKLDLWSAEIELAMVKFGRTPDTAIEFRNEIDVWSKMEFRFRQQIRDLKAGATPRQKSQLKKDFKELEALVYSIRERLEE